MNETVIDSLRHQANAKLDPKKKGALGQFMTPFKIAEFMAGLFTRKTGAVLLDAGAGIGSLTLAASNALELERAEAWEIDSVMVSYLAKNLEGLGVPYELHQRDFILDSIDRIQFNEGTRFTHAILNPPYKKISNDSIHRLACRQVGLETVNLYTAFLALAILQMKQDGEIVIIIPRSFCNGPYYKPFRNMMLATCSVDVIHVFESRSVAARVLHLDGSATERACRAWRRRRRAGLAPPRAADDGALALVARARAVQPLAPAPAAPARAQCPVLLRLGPQVQALLPGVRARGAPGGRKRDALHRAHPRRRRPA